MQTSYIEFKKKRELGDILSDTFKFLRKNFMPILKVLIRTTIIPFVLLLVAVGYYTYAISGVGAFNFFNNESFDIGTVVIALVLLLITGVLYNAQLFGSISMYIQAYNKHRSIPNVDEVAQSIIRDSWKFIVLGFINFLILVVISILCVLPGILMASTLGSEVLGVFMILLAIIPVLYFYVRFSLIYPVFIYDKVVYLNTFVRSGALVKGQWWMTFLTLLVIVILIGVIGFVFSLPGAIYNAVKAFSIVQEGSLSDPSSFTDWISISLQVIASAINYLLYIILGISINFIYFNLNELKNSTGTLEQIDRLGSSNDKL